VLDPFTRDDRERRVVVGRPVAAQKRAAIQRYPVRAGEVVVEIGGRIDDPAVTRRTLHHWREHTTILRLSRAKRVQSRSQKAADMDQEPRWKHDGVRIVAACDLDPNTPQTPGMNRAAAITTATAGAQKLWAGTVRIDPDARTGAHHHGELESVIYV